MSHCHKIPATVLLEAITANYISFFSPPVCRRTICIFPALSLVLVRNNSDYFWHFSELHNKILVQKNGWYFKYYGYAGTYILSDIAWFKHINTSQWLECYTDQILNSIILIHWLKYEVSQTSLPDSRDLYSSENFRFFIQSQMSEMTKIMSEMT